MTVKENLVTAIVTAYAILQVCHAQELNMLPMKIASFHSSGLSSEPLFSLILAPSPAAKGISFPLTPSLPQPLTSKTHEELNVIAEHKTPLNLITKDALVPMTSLSRNSVSPPNLPANHTPTALPPTTLIQPPSSVSNGNLPLDIRSSFSPPVPATGPLTAHLPMLNLPASNTLPLTFKIQSGDFLQSPTLGGTTPSASNSSSPVSLRIDAHQSAILPHPSTAPEDPAMKTLAQNTTVHVVPPPVVERVVQSKRDVPQPSQLIELPEISLSEPATLSQIVKPLNNTLNPSSDKPLIPSKQSISPIIDALQLLSSPVPSTSSVDPATKDSAPASISTVDSILSAVAESLADSTKTEIQPPQLLLSPDRKTFFFILYQPALPSESLDSSSTPMNQPSDELFLPTPVPKTTPTENTTTQTPPATAQAPATSNPLVEATTLPPSSIKLPRNVWKYLKYRFKSRRHRTTTNNPLDVTEANQSAALAAPEAFTPSSLRQKPNSTPISNILINQLNDAIEPIIDMPLSGGHFFNYRIRSFVEDEDTSEEFVT